MADPLKIERGIPAPITTDANSAAHRLDAEAEEFMKNYAATYARSVENALRDAHVHPAPWHEENIRKHWPELWTLWRQYQQALARLLKHVDSARKRYPDPE